MKQFALPESTPVKMVSIDFPKRKQGKRKVAGVRILVEIRAANTLLDQLNDLRHSLYMAGQAPSGQPDLPAVDAISDTPVLRIQNLDTLKLKEELTGYTAIFDLGMGRDSSNVELRDAVLDKFKITALQGGAILMRWRISGTGLGEREIGKLGMQNECDTSLKLIPPTIQDQLTGLTTDPKDAPDDGTEAVKADTAVRTKAKPVRKPVAKKAAKKTAAAKKKG